MQHQNDYEREEWKLYHKVVFSEITDLLKMQTIASKKATGCKLPSLGMKCNGNILCIS